MLGTLLWSGRLPFRGKEPESQLRIFACPHSIGPDAYVTRTRQACDRGHKNSFVITRPLFHNNISLSTTKREGGISNWAYQPARTERSQHKEC